MPNRSAKVRVRQIASRQSGRIAWYQLVAAGADKWTINAWVKQGYLQPRLPRVYAVGHSAPSVEADLAEALLYAGPGAMLSHATAAWWWGLIENPPSTINVSTPRRCRNERGVKIHQRRHCQRAWHKRMPVTSVAQTLLDYAATASLNMVRKALANAEYQKLLDISEVQALPGRGRPGSARLCGATNPASRTPAARSRSCSSSSASRSGSRSPR
jgi:hypothetical protein